LSDPRESRRRFVLAASLRAIAGVVDSYWGRARARVRSLRPHPKELDVTDPRHLLLVGTGPGLGAAIARRFRA
jgi:hypothetical protein